MEAKHQVYSDIELSTEISTASGHRLIQMLFDACLQQIRMGKVYIAEKNIQKKYASLSMAKDIVIYLRACLNFEDAEAKELCALLDSLYNFLEKNILQAALQNDVSFLDEAETVLSNIKSGWDGIAAKV